MNGSGRNGERRKSAREGETGQLMARAGEEGIMRRTEEYRHNSRSNIAPKG